MHRFASFLVAEVSFVNNRNANRTRFQWNDMRFPKLSAPTLSELYAELKLLQRRLGTTLEAPEDFERILFLAHQINNRLTIELLQQQCAQARASLSIVSISKRALEKSQTDAQRLGP